MLLGSEGEGEEMEDMMKGSEEDLLKKKGVPVRELMWMVVEYVMVWPFMCHVGLVLFVAWMASIYHFNVPFVSVLGFIYLFQVCNWLNTTYYSIYVGMGSFFCFCDLLLQTCER